ncbi:MAG TPA: diacylglycerol kinase [Allosphingosinicella sp.]|jgi:diacylglycerol kinase (ATP)
MPDTPQSTAKAFKGQPFRARVGYAAAGLKVVAKRERSFRIQLLLALAALGALAALRPGFVWAAVVILAIALVLALEAANAALEYLIDLLHPGIAEEIRHAKDAAAGAVLLASAGAAAVGLLMVLASLG